MIFPYHTAMTTGVVLILQMLLAAATSGARGGTNVWIGDGGKDGLLRATRRHANLAENSGLFLIALAMFELSRANPYWLSWMCIAFVALRVIHALGLSLTNTNNPLRLIGGAGTYLLGFIVGGWLFYLSYHIMLQSSASA